MSPFSIPVFSSLKLLVKRSQPDKSCALQQILESLRQFEKHVHRQIILLNRRGHRRHKKGYEVYEEIGLPDQFFILVNL